MESSYSLTMLLLILLLNPANILPKIEGAAVANAGLIPSAKNLVATESDDGLETDDIKRCQIEYGSVYVVPALMTGSQLANAIHHRLDLVRVNR